MHGVVQTAPAPSLGTPAAPVNPRCTAPYPHSHPSTLHPQDDFLCNRVDVGCHSRLDGQAGRGKGGRQRGSDTYAPAISHRPQGLPTTGIESQQPARTQLRSLLTPGANTRACCRRTLGTTPMRPAAYAQADLPLQPATEPCGPHTQPPTQDSGANPPASL